MGMPARLSSATASSRARGLGVCGSVARQASSSSVGSAEVGADRGDLGDLKQKVEIAQQQRRLREHRAGVGEIPERLPDPPHQLVAALDRRKQSVFVPSATCLPFHCNGRASSVRRTSGTLTLTTISRSKSDPG